MELSLKKLEFLLGKLENREIFEFVFIFIFLPLSPLFINVFICIFFFHFFSYFLGLSLNYDFFSKRFSKFCDIHLFQSDGWTPRILFIYIT